MAKSLMLDLDEWDLTLDAAGNIAVTTDAYAVAQNVANAVRLFTDDAWYDPQRGIPHFMVDLGHRPDASVVRNRVRKAALGVDGVAAAVVTVAGEDDRVLGGNIELTLTTGEYASVDF